MQVLPDRKIVELNDIPDEKLQIVVEDFQSEGAKVERKRQPDGKWTVIGQYDLGT